MTTFLAICLGLCLAATVIVLFTGLIGMAINGPFYKKNANKLMRLRVFCQALSIGFFLLLILAAKN